jgi:hypothetical protein
MIRAFLFALLCLACSLYTALATDAEGLKFLEAKGKEEGVVTLPSGLLYKELRAGNRECLQLDAMSLIRIYIGLNSSCYGLNYAHVQPTERRPQSTLHATATTKVL